MGREAVDPNRGARVMRFASLPEATYLAWLDLRAYTLGDDPAAALLDGAQIALGSGPDFGEHGVGFARLNLATSRVVLEEAIDRLVSAAAPASTEARPHE